MMYLPFAHAHLFCYAISCPECCDFLSALFMMLLFMTFIKMQMCKTMIEQPNTNRIEPRHQLSLYMLAHQVNIYLGDMNQ